MPDLAAPHAALAANLTALYRRDPALAMAVDLHPDADALPCEPTRSGALTACRARPDGQTIYLHSRYDPAAEARRLCESVAVAESPIAVLCGLGLGYEARALLDALAPHGVVMVSEPHLPTIRTALEHADFSAEIAAGRLILLTTLDKQTLHERLTPLSTLLMLGTKFVVPPAAQVIDADFHAACRANITDFAAFSKMSLLTLVANSRITCENVAANLPAALASPGVERLTGRFAGYPAIIVSAGPSLSKNIARLADAAGRAVLIAVQTTLKPLLARGIRPDFVTTLDFSDLSRRFFEGVPDFGRTLMVAEPKAAWAVIDAFRGKPGPGARPVMLLDNEFARRCVGDALAGRAALPAGSTVAHLSFYLAQHLGCDPIILVGQDLAFSGHVYYTPGVAIHDAWAPELGRFCTLEQKEWERIVRHRPILRRVPDASGRPLYTDEQMFTYLEQFERDFAACPVRVIDATEGGAAKRGTVAMPLKAAIATHCREPIPPERWALRDAPWPYDAARVAAGREQIVQRQVELAEFRCLCEQTADVLARLQTVLDDPPRFNQLIVRVDELRTRVCEHDRIFRMVCDLSQLAELQKFKADQRLAASKADAGRRAAEQLARDRRFVASLLEGCDALARIFDLTLSRFDAELTAAEARP